MGIQKDMQKDCKDVRVALDTDRLSSPAYSGQF